MILRTKACKKIAMNKIYNQYRSICRFSDIIPNIQPSCTAQCTDFDRDYVILVTYLSAWYEYVDSKNIT